MIQFEYNKNFLGGIWICKFALQWPSNVKEKPMEIVDQTLVGIVSQVHERIAILMKYSQGIQRAQARKSSITN